MKKRRIMATFLTAALLAGSMAGCGSGDGNKSAVPDLTASKPPVTSEANEQEQAAPPASDTVDGEINQQTYPISQEKITLSLWYPQGGSMGELADFNDGEFWKWYEEKTNIHIDFIVPASGTEKDSFQLLFASDNIPDMVNSQPASYSYRGGEDKAIEDDYFINMADYLDMAPNYVSWLNSHEDFGRAAYSDTGKMYGMWGVWDTMEENAYADQGLAIRKDFLDKVGLDVPETYDEWETVLTAFKDKLNIDAPLYTSKFGIDHGDFMAGYDTAPYFYQNDGKVKYGPMDDAYKDYLILLHKWWESGLLDKDFATRASTGITADNDMMLNDKVGALVDYGTRMSDTYLTRGATNPDFYLVAAPQPKKSGIDAITPAWRDYNSGSDRMHGMCMTFNSHGEHIEEAIRWNDGFYGKDVYLNANFGLDEEKDTVWYAAEDGHRIGDYDFRYSNPDGISSATVLVQFWTKNPPVRVESAQIEQSDENKQESYKVWSQFDPTQFIPTRTTMTSEEGTSFASKYTDIETYVQECNVKFIMGQMSLDDYDSYRSTLTSMGIEECITLQQAALDRYNAR